jgi:hypothetical protein
VGPEPTTRNLFRFQPKAPPPPPPGARAAMAAAQAQAAPAVPPPPPIPLKLIGIIDGARGGKIAVLTDSASRGGDTYYGQEGDVIDGRYRILKIGIESVDMEYVDGRGRQPIRLSGQ